VGLNCSGAGDVLYSIAVVWLIYRTTGSALATAGLSAAIRAAPLFLGPIAGVYVDRWNPRRAMIGADALRMGLVLILAAWVWRHGSVFWVYPVVFSIAAVGMVFGPSLHVVLSRILAPPDRSAGNGLYQAVRQATAFLANAAGGVLVAAVGPVLSVVLDAVSFAFSMGAVWLAGIPRIDRAPSPAHQAGASTVWRDLREGWHAVREEPRITSLMGLLFTATVGSAAFMALLPVVVFQRLQGGPAILGLLESGAVVGGVKKLRRTFGMHVPAMGDKVSLP